MDASRSVGRCASTSLQSHPVELGVEADHDSLAWAASISRAYQNSVFWPQYNWTGLFPSTRCPIRE